MPDFRISTFYPNSIKLGASTVSKIYVGTTLVYPLTLTSFQMYSNDGDTTCASAIEFGSYYPLITLWHNGTSALPKVGDTIYTTSAGTTTFNGLNSYWCDLNEVAPYQISTTGVVLVVCSAVNTAPTFTSALTSSAQTTTSITLNWVSTDNVGVTNQVLWWRVSGGTYASIALSSSATSYVKTGLSAGVSYNFYIVASDVAALSTSSNTLTQSTASAGGISYSTNVLSNSYKQFVISGLNTSSQSYTINYTLLNRVFALTDGSTYVNLDNNTHLYTNNVGSNLSGTISGGTLTHNLQLVNYSNFDSCTIRCTVTALGIDSIPSVPAYYDINLNAPSPE